MIVSIAVTLYLGRGTTFSGDEMVLVVTSPDFDLQAAFQPHVGHLLLVPRLIYLPLLESFGLSYLPYRILTVLAVCLTVGLLFAWLIRRVPKWVALVPCVILLFFGTDHLHMLQGNGFTICFSLAMGLLALLMLERGDRFGDVFACLALVLGVATYSVALPLIVGAAVLVLINRQWTRIWIAAVPWGCTSPGLSGARVRSSEERGVRWSGPLSSSCPSGCSKRVGLPCTDSAALTLTGRPGIPST